MGAIIQLESPGFRQFTSAGEPIFGGPDGWGIAQLDYSQGGGTATTMEVWNWQVNLSSGLAIIEDKRRAAVAYFAVVKSANPQKWEEPPASYRDARTHTSLSSLDAAIITLYNGGSTQVKDSRGNPLNSCWKFTPENAPGKRWSFVPNSHDYVYQVVSRMEQGY